MGDHWDVISNERPVGRSLADIGANTKKNVVAVDWKKNAQKLEINGKGSGNTQRSALGATYTL